ncbi:two-component system, NtrC family, nitrogen regulation sensor histidine kinase NtrY [Thermotomaculum hydrothermale]|uniref:histidine kinase n=1 Tax=Thermotomaculum hydrothermale TaxID=981385 RepID=A0A7R6PSR2_9BACT|nr:ATP-binding protein [Thermotomaculum hydrothermale]BBB33641.1 two-component system, NtrC family, nitrogen regulation sensor histidine kinase NtrY [Thermotomaculum hydrothermale]
MKKRYFIFVLFAILLTYFFYTYLRHHISFFDKPNIFLNILGIINVILVLILLFIPIRRIVKPYFEGKKTGFYTLKIRTKFIIMSIILVVVPSMIILSMATVIIYKIMNTWHNPDLLDVLKGAEKIATSYQSEIAKNTAHFTKVLGDELTPDLLSNREKLIAYLDKSLAKYGLSSVEVYQNKNLIVMVRNKKEPLRELKAISMRFPKKLDELSFSQIEQLPTGIFIRFGTIIPVSGLEKRYTIVGGKLIIQNISSDLHFIVGRYKRFQAVQEDIYSLKLFNITSLILIGIMSMFSGLWAGIKFTDMLLANFNKLVYATEKVANNEFDFTIEVKGSDEFAKLLESFNKMLDVLRTHDQEIRLRSIELETLNKVLKEKKEFFETVLDNLPVGVIALKNYGQVVSINLFAKKLLKIKGKVHEGVPFPAVAKNSEAGRYIVEALEEMTKSGEHFQKKLTSFNTLEGAITSEVSFILMKDQYSKEVGYLVIIEDVTELEQAQKMIAWKEAVRRIVHELKNPLTPIKLSAERIKRRAEEDSPNLREIVLESLKPMIEEINAMQYLIENFSRYAKMPPPELEPTDINLLIEDILSLYSSLPGNIKIKRMLAENLPLLNIDKKLMKRAILNIVKNAINAVEDEGGGTITIKTIYFASGRKVNIEISDTGKGIPDTLKEKIFIPYFSTKPKGDGLGLAIVRNIIQAHNGHVFVKNNFPQGTTFVIELPI